MFGFVGFASLSFGGPALSKLQGLTVRSSLRLGYKRFLAPENLCSKEVRLPLLMLNIVWNLTFMKQLQRGFEIIVIISMENREELGNRGVSVSIEERHVTPLPVLCALCPPSVPENMLLQFCAISFFPPGNSLSKYPNQFSFLIPTLQSFVREIICAYLIQRKTFGSVEDRMLSKEGLGSNPLWPFSCYIMDYCWLSYRRLSYQHGSIFF